jgi:hypothetical protein
MKEKRTRKVTVRFTPTEYQKLEKKFRSTTSNQLSHYVRQILLDKPVVIKYRNTSLDNFMEEVIQLRQELNAIGNNYNQAVKKLHVLSQIPEFRQWITSNESTHQHIINQTDHIQQRITQFSNLWLQE